MVMTVRLRMIRASLMAALALSVALIATGQEGSLANASAYAEDLFMAVKAGKSGRIEALIGRGANPNVRDAEGMTPLHYAAYRGDVAIGEALLRGGADPNAKDSLGMTPLHAAAFEGRADFVKALLLGNAFASARDAAGNTALHYAVYGGHVETAKALLAGGADAAVSNAKGATPADMARASGRKELIDLFGPAVATKPPRVITNETLATLPTDSHFVVQEGRSGEDQASESGAEAAGGGYPHEELKGRTGAEKVNAGYQRIEALTREKRSLQDKLPELEKKCDEFVRFQRGEQVGTTRRALKDDDIGMVDAYGLVTYVSPHSYEEIKRSYSEAVPGEEQTSCGSLQSVKKRIASIERTIDDLRDQIAKINAQAK
jgi:ankyrin repeat protein